MSGSSKPCPKCGEQMEVGKLMGWNEKTKKYGLMVELVENPSGKKGKERSFGITLNRCPKCNNLDLNLD